MISKIKMITVSIFGTLLAIAGVAIKFLLWKNKKKEKRIEDLKREAELTKKIHKRNIDRAVFNAKQREKAKSINDESHLDRLDSKRKISNDENDFWRIINR